MVDRLVEIRYNMVIVNNKEREMTDEQYSLWMVKDTAKALLHAVAMYAVVLGAYWTLVG